MIKSFKAAFILVAFAFSALAIANPVIQHTPNGSINAGKRLGINADISAASGVKTARVYFKSSASSNYDFVVLNQRSGSRYIAHIPAAGSNINAIDYKIVVQDAELNVAKSVKFTTQVMPTGEAVAESSESGFIEVFSEYPQPASQSSGFVDTVRYSVDVVRLVDKIGTIVEISEAATSYANASTTSTYSSSSTASSSPSYSSTATNTSSYSSSATTTSSSAYSTAATGTAAGAGTGATVGGVLLGAAAIGGGAYLVNEAIEEEDDYLYGAGSYCAYNYPEDACDIVIQESFSAGYNAVFIPGIGSSTCSGYAGSVSETFDYGYTDSTLGRAGACVLYY